MLSYVGKDASKLTCMCYVMVQLLLPVGRILGQLGAEHRATCVVDFTSSAQINSQFQTIKPEA